MFQFLPPTKRAIRTSYRSLLILYLLFIQQHQVQRNHQELLFRARCIYQALGIENFSGLTGVNVTGTSDLAPLDQQAAMIKEIAPETKTVGIIYCSGEPNQCFMGFPLSNTDFIFFICITCFV